MKMNFILSIFLLLPLCALAQKDSLADKDTALKLYKKFDVEASYPGGPKAWQKYIELSPILTKARIEAERQNIGAGEYTVLIRYMVTKNGDLDKVTTLTKHGFGLEAAAIKFMLSSGKWIPAEVNNGKVDAYRMQPILFSVD
jgi:periplasmic protein TonB